MAKVKTCPHCEKEFLNSALYTSHVEHCPSKPKVTPNLRKAVYTTCRCGKEFTSKSTYEQHRQTCRKAR